MSQTQPQVSASGEKLREEKHELGGSKDKLGVGGGGVGRGEMTAPKSACALNKKRKNKIHASKLQFTEKKEDCRRQPKTKKAVRLKKIQKKRKCALLVLPRSGRSLKGGRGPDPRVCSKCA